MTVDEVSVSHSSAYSSRKAAPTGQPIPMAQYDMPTSDQVKMEDATITTRSAAPLGVTSYSSQPTTEYQTTKTVTTTTTTEVDPASRGTIRTVASTGLPVSNMHYVGGTRLPENAYEASTRKVSSVVLESTPLSQLKTDNVRYVEVPTIEEQVTYVTVKETREIEKKVEVPQYQYDVVEEYREVPVYVDKYVDKEVVEYVTREVPVPQVVERVVDVEKPTYVKRPVQVVKRREVPGPVVERQVPYNVEVKKQVVRHQDTDVPVIVAQTVRPVITESDRKISVDVLDYEPEVIPVDVHVAKPVTAAVEQVGRTEARHRLVNITSGQYNTILKLLNQHMDQQSRSTLPFVAEGGRVPFIPDHEAQFIVAPADITIENWNRPILQRNVSIPVSTRARGVEEGSVLEQQPRGNACCGGTKRTKTTTETQVYTVQQPRAGASTSGYPAPSTMSQPVYVEGSQAAEPLASQHGSYVSRGPSYVSRSAQPSGQEFVGETLEHQSNLSFKPSTQTKRTVCC